MPTENNCWGGINAEIIKQGMEEYAEEIRAKEAQEKGGNKWLGMSGRKEAKAKEPLVGLPGAPENYMEIIENQG